MREPDPKPASDPSAAFESRPTVVGSAPVALPPIPTDLPIPVRLGQYHLLGELGRGGIGVVYRAHDPHLNSDVALKAMLPRFAANPQAKERFLRKARAQSTVEHEHVAAIHAVAEQDGVAYLVMPLLKGMTLQTALRVNPLPALWEVIRIAREIAEGLAAAQQQGLVHRNLKPANIWLEGEKRRVKVLDFGLPRSADVAPESRSVSGSVGGDGTSVDDRSDLWNLGVLLYQMTTGELPFSGADSLASPTPPSAKNPAVPMALSELVLRLLSKDLGGRPPSHEAVVGALRSIEAALGRSGRLDSMDVTRTRSRAPEAPGPFADLGATTSKAAKSASRPATSKTHRKPTGKTRRGLPIWALVVLLLALVGLVGLVVSQLDNKPDEVALDLPQPKKEKPGKGTIPQPGKEPAKDADRRGAEYTLSIGGSVTVNGDIREIKVVGELPPAAFQLTDLNLGANQQVNDAGLAAFKDCKNLTSLWLYNTKVGDAGLAHFRGCKNLTNLHLADTQVSDAGLAAFTDCTNLTGLSLSGTRVGDAGLVYFKECTNLTGLGLNNTQVTDAGLAFFKDCKNLAGVGLNNTQVTDVGIANLKGCKNLTILGVGGTRVSDAGLAHLRGCENLKELYLFSTQVSDAGVVHLRDCRNLTVLHLGETQVSDAGLQQLVDKTKLTSLVLGRAKVTEAGVKRLAAALPQCKIEWDGGIIEPMK